MIGKIYLELQFQTKVKEEWIDYNGYMQDSYYGLVFGYAVDAFEDKVGFDRLYRQKTGCTIYLVEEHKYFLREIKENDIVEVNFEVFEVGEKLFHLYCTKYSNNAQDAISELLEMHVQQRPATCGIPISVSIYGKLKKIL